MSQIILVTGKKGSGKSFLVNSLIQKAEKPVIILDVAVHSKKGSNYNYEDKLESVSDFLALSKAYAEDKNFTLKTLSLQFSDPDDYLTAFEILRVYEDVLIVIEEAHSFMNPLSIDSNLAKLIRLARNQNLDLIFLTHRPVDFHGLIITQADTVISFREDYEKNMKRLSEITFVGTKAFTDLPVLRDLGTDGETGIKFSEWKLFGDNLRI